MSNNLKKRIYTSLGLFLLLILMYKNIFILSYSLLIVGLLSIIEFHQLNLNIFRKNKIKAFAINLIFIFYIFLICSGFLVFSTYSHIKIIIFIILIICIFSDIGGYIFGKIFKGPKLTKVSPNKTISGAIGSLFFSSLIGLMMIFYITKNFEPSMLVVSCITSVACQCGDLFFSFLKRKSNLKDTGNFLPGHGGVLDRVDGMLLGMPIGFLTLMIIY